MYAWMQLSSSADLAQLANAIPTEYDAATVAQTLSGGISDAVKAILIESDYVDKDYRSTYYNFYAKKGQRYRNDCVRLHFFDRTVSFDADKLAPSCADRELNNHYFGYMVLRPTGVATIGRTVLSPDIRRGAGRLIITANHKVHLLGYRFEIHGFPWMNQHVDISVCAHAACWSILRHYSERYNVYREFLTHDITMMAHEFNPGGLVPSRGLQMAHAERVFQEAATFPVHIARSKDKSADPSFYRQMIAYVESRFPIFAAMSSRRHAVAIVGYEWLSALNTGAPRLRFAWDALRSLAVVDDNFLPYMSISTTADAPRSAKDYSAEDIDSLIVALPEKMFYPADAVDRLGPALFKLGAVVGLPPRDNTIIRYFITTGSALRSFVREKAGEFDPRLLTTIMTIPFAQFVWIVEFATESQWARGVVEARAVIDATASLTEAMPLWLFHGQAAALVFDRKTVGQITDGVGVLTLVPAGHTGFTRMERNLRATQAK